MLVAGVVAGHGPRLFLLSFISRTTGPISETSPLPLPPLKLAAAASGSRTRVAPATRLAAGAVATQSKASPATPTINRINRTREVRTAASLGLVFPTVNESNHRRRPFSWPFQRPQQAGKGIGDFSRQMDDKQYVVVSMELNGQRKIARIYIQRAGYSMMSDGGAGVKSSLPKCEGSVLVVNLQCPNCDACRNRLRSRSRLAKPPHIPNAIPFKDRKCLRKG
ncbi:hypothetical protein V8G54_023305 [Vigna mungo]|uniref:Uncharacterized protein n=1 Tax=Vigna mungo TaxID=3915 RepID=A0AAQ3RP36_VIGMU